MKLIIEKCFKNLLKIQHNHKNIFIKIIKIKSNTDVQGNNTIVNLLREKTKITYYEPTLTKLISYSVSRTEIPQFSISQWKMLCSNSLNPSKYYYKYNKSRFSNKISRLLSTSNFNKSQSGVMIRLISQHIELNKYLSHHNIEDPNTNKNVISPLCT